MGARQSSGSRMAWQGWGDSARQRGALTWPVSGSLWQRRQVSSRSAATAACCRAWNSTRPCLRAILNCTECWSEGMVSGTVLRAAVLFHQRPGNAHSKRLKGIL